MPGHYDRPKIRGGHGNSRRKSVHHPMRKGGGMGGNNTVTGWYWPSHITPPDQVMSAEPDIVDPCQDLGSTCFTDTYGNCECYARTPGY